MAFECNRIECNRMHCDLGTAGGLDGECDGLDWTSEPSLLPEWYSTGCKCNVHFTLYRPFTILEWSSSAFPETNKPTQWSEVHERVSLRNELAIRASCMTTERLCWAAYSHLNSIINLVILSESIWLNCILPMLLKLCLCWWPDEAALQSICRSLQLREDSLRLGVMNEAPAAQPPCHQIRVDRNWFQR